MGAYWHPFAAMGKVAGHEVVIERGEGVYVYDTSGKRYLDGTASLWYCNVGYGRTEIADAVAEQMRRLHAFHTFGDFATPPTLDLAERLAGLAPMPGTKVFLTSGGSDSVDTAAKLARRYFSEIGEPDRRVYIKRTWAYHGMHAAGTSLAGMAPNMEGYGDLIPDVVEVPWDDLDALESTIDDVGADRVAAFFCEPVIGAGGVRFAPEGYLKGARELIAEVGALFIADEVITGFGRAGAWFASDRFGLDPDMITFAKGVTSGYLPLGGVLIGRRVAEPFWEPGSSVMWRHGYTYSGHSSACVAALVNLDIIEREDLVTRTAAMEGTFAQALETLLDHPVADSIRTGAGLLGAVQLSPDLLAERPSAAADAANASRAAGVITRAIGGGGLQASPPLTITEAQIDELVAGLRSGLDAVA